MIKANVTKNSLMADNNGFSFNEICHIKNFPSLHDCNKDERY